MIDLKEFMREQNIRMSLIAILSAVAYKELGFKKGHKFTLKMYEAEVLRLKEGFKDEKD